jgi:multidrug efflux pump subunit AcrA (membrane-fusion protein)
MTTNFLRRDLQERPSYPRSRRSRRRWGPLLLVLFAGCTPNSAPTEAAKESPAVPVTADVVRARELRRTIPVTGTLAGFEDITLSPKVDGRILTARYDVGDPAVPGAVLLDIDPTDARNAVAMERRSLDAELARLGLTELPPAEFDVDAVPEVQRAEAARLNARRTYDRVTAVGSASRQELDAAETELKVAEANKRAAFTVARATLAAAKMRRASLDMAEQKLADCQLRVPEPAGWGAWAAAVGPGAAPGRFTVATKMASEGEMVRSMPGTNVYRLVASHILKLKVTVPERYTPEVKVGQPVDVRVDAFPDAVFVGRVARVSPTIDTQSRTFHAEVHVPNPTDKLKAGGFARAEIVIGAAAVTTIPPAALVVFAGVSKVFVTDGTAAKAVPVEVGVREKDWIEVRGELRDGEKVVTSGFSRLFDGSPVKVRE